MFRFCPPCVNDFFPPFPTGPIRRLDVTEAVDGFEVSGAAVVRAEPFRSTDEAREIAERIAASRVYLFLALHVGLVGVEDIRPGHGQRLSYGLRRAS